VKDARYLIRISPGGQYKPADQAGLLKKVRDLAKPFGAKTINLRVTPVALEFDLFCAPETTIDPILSSFQSIGNVITCKRLDAPAVAVHAPEVVAEARQLFNEHRFWEVHEVLEGLWKELKGEEKQLVQGLILVAAALVHIQKDENEVAWTMLSDALRRLESQPAVYYGWEIQKLREHFVSVLAAKELIIPTV